MPFTSVLGARLSQIPFFAALSDSSIGALEPELGWLSVSVGWTLFREDDVADALYVVLAGAVPLGTSGGSSCDT